jgi:biopolymer transport protein ExbD
MARFSRMIRQAEEEPELNMIPIMNMFMVLIPFLLMSASFFHIKAINTSIPIHADMPANRYCPERVPQNYGCSRNSSRSRCGSQPSQIRPMISS